jgi:TRAP-type mannitol/chloroaromatic compound transport system permease small subunit
MLGGSMNNTPSRIFERLNLAIGRTTAWLTLVMVIVTFVVVVLRYVFDFGWIWLQETIGWMHAAVFMLAGSYTLAKDAHVRVDIFYRNWSPQRRALIDTAGTLIFLLPFCGFLLWSSWDYVATSWSIQEGSREAGGLVYPFTSLLKSMIPILALLLFLQALAILGKSLSTLRGD